MTPEEMRERAARASDEVAEFHREMFRSARPNPDSNQRHLLAAEACEAVSEEIRAIPIPPTPPDPSHASAPLGYKCADCTMDGEACPSCYEAAWRKRHPNMHHEPPDPSASDRIGTHAPGCHAWGPRHYECLMRKYEASKAALKVAEEALEPFAIFAPFIKHKSDDETVLSGHGKRHEWTHLLARHFRDAVAVLEAIRKITGGTE
jgi:hypothetical protein